MARTRLVAALASLMMLPLIGCAHAQPTILYDVELERAASQVVRIHASAPAAGEPVDFVLPVWRPGRYGVLDFAATVREWSASDDAGRALDVEKVRKNVWRVTPRADSGRITLTYDIYAASLGDRTRHADDTHAFLSGSSVFVLVPPHRDDDHGVRIELLDGWSVATSMRPDATGVLKAESYDVLIDSPIEAGLHQSQTFDTDGVETTVAIWGEVTPDWDRIERDFRAVHLAVHNVFGGQRHFDEYLYITHLYPGGGGGTEHLTSTVVQGRPNTLDDPDRYRGFLSLVAHEYFHTWNVKHFRPAGITPYDYSAENYTRLLWLVEGTTSYYDELVLVRAGITTPDDYLGTVASTIRSTKRRPGAARSSLEDSSFDAWLKFWGPDSPDHSNTSVNFYSHGAMASMTLDLLIRDATSSTRSLDDAMRLLYERFDWREKGYTPDDVRSIIAEVAGRSMDSFFDAHIAGIEPPPFEAALLLAGLVLSQDEPDGPPTIGIRSRWDGEADVVTRLPDNEPAFHHGINVGDRIIAVDGMPLEDRTISERIEGRSPGDTVTLDVLRNERALAIEIELGPPAPGRFRIEHVERPSDRQRAVYEGWLGQPWPSSEAAEATSAEAAGS
ncbi:MAG: PDZ domain-containing protein [Planctomycetota bacterium]